MTNRNAYFGARRQTSNRLEDFGYSDMAFATGDQDRIKQLQTQLDAKNDERATLVDKIGRWNADITTKRATVKQRESYMYGKDQLCKWHYSQSKCNGLRDDYRKQWVDPVKASINQLSGEVTAMVTNRKALDVEIANITQEIATLLETQQLEAESTLTLAQQGKTPEQIKIEAQAQANAIAEKSRVEAEKKERKSKSTRTIILSIVLGAVLLTGLFVFYKIRKNRNK